MKNNMFNDISKTKWMLECSYKKLKSYYYYNKNYIFMKEKIADFEYDLDLMDTRLTELAEVLARPKANKYKDLLTQLISQVDFYILPKSFIANEKVRAEVVSNVIGVNKNLQKVNFFINMPIELFIMDTLWTLLFGKITHDQKVISEDCYGNTLDEKYLFNRKTDFIDSINFEGNRMFNIYFNKYSKWRNGAFDTLERNWDNRKWHSVLLSLDIKSYFYSVKMKFKGLINIVNQDSKLENIRVLTKIISTIYDEYSVTIKPYRKEPTEFKKGETLLPIGLFSSMLLGNVYLSTFDNKVKSCSNISYYGRYVDDLLFVFKAEDIADTTVNSLLKSNLVKSGLFSINSDNNLTISEMNNLNVQTSKIKVIHIDPTKSKNIIDTFNKSVRILPSQMNVLPNYQLDITDFEESAYIVENLTNENKLRDIGNVSISSFRISRYLSGLVQKQKSINVNKSKEAQNEINNQISKINTFFTGNQSIEFYSNWQNILYFLMLNRRKKDMNKFYYATKKFISNLDCSKIEDIQKNKKTKIRNRLKEYLLKHLDICMCTALALDYELLSITSLETLTKKIHKANLFNHYLVSFPLINYIDFKDKVVPLSKIGLKDLSEYDRKIDNNFKVKWSPRFIKLEELFMYWFIYKFDIGGNVFVRNNNKQISHIIDKFYEINNIWNKNIAIKVNVEDILNKYSLQTITLNSHPKSKVKIAVANIKITKNDCTNALLNPWINLTIKNKKQLFEILQQAYDCEENKVDFIILPEFYLPLHWLNDIMEFSRRSNIAIITGLQYLTDSKRKAFNFIATILPFSNRGYRNAFLLIREKNDYSPIEKEGLAKQGFTCIDSQQPTYQIYNLGGVDFGTFLCYEFTDIIARSLYKARVDMLFTPEFNPDTTYFSNIIETTTRDLHTVIIQSNTSVFGDSRITGPYSRDQRNIVQIKGGDTDGIIIGTIDLQKILKYQAEYDAILKNKIKYLLKYKKIKKENIKTGMKISKLSARYDTQRARDKLR